MLKVPVTPLRRKVTLWLQQGVLREDPPGTFTVIEEEQKDRAEKVVLIDSDEEGDSAMASQADQKEEELQVRRSCTPRAPNALATHPLLFHGTPDLLSCRSLPVALLDVHPGHANQPGESVPGAYPQHAEDLCDDGAHGDGNRHPGAAGLPAEEGLGPAAHLLGWSLPPAQELQLTVGGPDSAFLWPPILWQPRCPSFRLRANLFWLEQTFFRAHNIWGLSGEGLRQPLFFVHNKVVAVLVCELVAVLLSETGAGAVLMW